MSNTRKIVTKLVKMSETDAAALARVTLLTQQYYQQQCPDALAVELPSVSHVLRALIRYADEVTSGNPMPDLGVVIVERCATAGGRWD